MDFLDRLKKEGFKDKALKKAYDDLELEFSIISQIIKKRNKLGLTQKELAERIGTKQPSIARFEAGLSNPTIGFLQKVSEALGSKLVVKI
jgi:predicted transcriptional regulator